MATGDHDIESSALFQFLLNFEKEKTERLRLTEETKQLTEVEITKRLTEVEVTKRIMDNNEVEKEKVKRMRTNY